jgi:hypothetical protein
MKNEEELNADILKITMTMRDRYPELTKYISEMPVTVPDEKNPTVNIKNLQDYYDSLKQILIKYAPSHTD